MKRLSRLLAIFLIASSVYAQAPTLNRSNQVNRNDPDQREQPQPQPRVQNPQPEPLAPPPPPPLENAPVTIPEGTSARVELQTQLNSKLNEPGDELVGRLESSVVINGVVALKRGTEVYGRVVQITKAKRPQRQASMTIVFDRIATPAGEREIGMRITSIDDFANEAKLKSDDEGKVKGGRDGGKTLGNVLTGAGIGGISAAPVLIGVGRGGSLAGGLAVGSAIGAGAIAGVLLTKGKEIRLEPGTIFRIEFTKPYTTEN